jgi:HSP20 family protein
LSFSNAELWQPQADIKETETEFKITTEIAGVNPEDVEVEIADGVLTITGHKESKNEKEGEKVHLSERQFGAFSRSWTLPTTVSENDISASFQHGVLAVTVTKTHMMATPKKIKVQLIEAKK